MKLGWLTLSSSLHPVESPAGVGYSYSNTTSDYNVSCSCCVLSWVRGGPSSHLTLGLLDWRAWVFVCPHWQTNNTATARDNYKALQLFFERFPQYSSNEVWISGESYGGDYGTFTQCAQHVYMSTTLASHRPSHCNHGAATVPQLVEQVLDGPDATLKAALHGFIIGNPTFSCPAWEATANDLEV